MQVFASRMVRFPRRDFWSGMLVLQNGTLNGFEDEQNIGGRRRGSKNGRM